MFSAAEVRPDPTQYGSLAALVMTGMDVMPMIKSAERNNTREPMNIQNSREDVSSSFAIAGMDLYLLAKRAIAGTAMIKRNIRRCQTVIPSPVNAWTEVSCRSPLLVRYVE